MTVLVLANSIPIDVLADEADILSTFRVSGTNSGYKGVGTKNFHTQKAVTQFLIGHVCFRKYPHRFGHDSSPTRANCEDELIMRSIF